jgi:hypothetical protein
MLGDPFDLDILRVGSTDLGLAAKQAVAPAKIEKRSKDFVRFPMSWYERLKKPPATGVTLLVALHLLRPARTIPVSGQFDQVEELSCSTGSFMIP